MTVAIRNTKYISQRLFQALVVSGLLIVVGCAGKSRLPLAEERPADKVEKPISARGYNHFVNANLLEIFGAFPEAIREYQNALKYFPESVTIRTDYARLLFRLQRTPEALEQALKIEPKDSDVNLLIGDCYRLMEDPDMAMVYYGAAVESDSDNINAYWYMAGYYQQKGMADSAIEAYFQLARLSDTYRIWQELGRMLGQNGRFIEAMEAFKRSIELNADKNNINAFLGLATTYDALDSLEQAERTYERAIELDEYDVRIFRHMLAMYLNREEYEKAIQASEKIVTLVPSDWVAQRRLGVLLYSSGFLDRADSLFGSRIEFGDDNPLNFFYRGRIALEQNRYDSAVEYLNESILRDSAFSDSWLNLGFVYRELDSLDKTIEILQRGIDYVIDTQDSVRLMFSLGSAMERNDQFYDAVGIFKEIIRLNAEHAPSLNYLGYMLADRGEQLSYALELIERAIAIIPDNAAFIDSYGWVLYKLGNYDSALSQLQRAAELLDTDPVVFEHIGDVQRALGDEDAARESYHRALELNPDSLNLKEKLGE